MLSTEYGILGHVRQPREFGLTKECRCPSLDVVVGIGRFMFDLSESLGL
jgi:hypothetical protein